jgi:hypothetical protein
VPLAAGPRPRLIARDGVEAPHERYSPRAARGAGAAAHCPIWPAPVAADAVVLVCPRLGGERATPVSLQPHITDADLQAVVNETQEVYDIDADDLRDLLERLEARIGAR